MHTIARAATIAVAFLSPAVAQITGSIHTTTSNGTVVNGNVYGQASDVYLAGGPSANSPCTAPGLPDGHYYFQVTDPSGAALLSLDSILDREVVVQGGVIQSHVTATHATGNGPCGSRVVQLIPFAPTPSASGEHKVWLTPVAAYDPALSGFHGFQPSSSKTDNFKVRSGTPVEQSVISGFKFYDHSEDGVWNPGVDPAEVPIAGWRIEILRNGVVDDVTYTDDVGRYTFIRDRDGATWTIREIAPGGFIGDGIAGAVWLATTQRWGTVVADAAEVHGPDFGNISFEVKPGVGRTKGFWHNRNGKAILALNDAQWRDTLTVRHDIILNLRRPVQSNDPQTSIFRPLPLPATFEAAHADFAAWIVGNPTIGHAGFILSSQLAASILNHDFGFMQFTTYVDVHQDGILVSFEDLVEHAAGLLSTPSAGLTGPKGAVEEREHILYCINEFSGINNTGDPVAPQVVYGSSPRPKTFATPYVL